MAIPAPAAGPGREAMVGLWTCLRLPVRVLWRSFRIFIFWSIVWVGGGFLFPMLFTSPPAQKAFPLPVRIIDPTVSSEAISWIVVRSAGVMVSPNAFRTSGLFKVIVATRSWISHNNSSVPVSTLMVAMRKCLPFHRFWLVRRSDPFGVLLSGPFEGKKIVIPTSAFPRKFTAYFGPSFIYCAIPGFGVDKTTYGSKVRI